MIDVLRLRMESSIHMTVQHSHTVDSLQQENSLLSNQLNQHKLEIQQLRVWRQNNTFTFNSYAVLHHSDCCSFFVFTFSDQSEIQRRNSDMAAAELERRQLQASVTEQNQRIWEETLEKQQLTTQLELQRVQLLNITSELNVYHHKKKLLSIVCGLRHAHTIGVDTRNGKCYRI